MCTKARLLAAYHVTVRVACNQPRPIIDGHLTWLVRTGNRLALSGCASGFLGVASCARFKDTSLPSILHPHPTFPLCFRSSVSFVPINFTSCFEEFDNTMVVFADLARRAVTHPRAAALAKRTLSIQINGDEEVKMPEWGLLLLLVTATFSFAFVTLVSTPPLST